VKQDEVFSEKLKAQEDNKKYIILGKLNAHHGVKGWLKIYSYTDPKENILSYKKVYVFKEGKSEYWKEIEFSEGRIQGKGIVAHIKDCNSREASEQFIGSSVGILKEDLKALEEDEIYWHDLIGLTVINQEGITLGKIESMLATPANDVMVIKPAKGSIDLQKEYLIPYIKQFVLEVDTKLGEVEVDWDSDF